MKKNKFLQSFLWKGIGMVLWWKRSFLLL